MKCGSSIRFWIATGNDHLHRHFVQRYPIDELLSNPCTPCGGSFNGTGIPEGRLREIFDSFVTTKQHGTGLGLSIARTIVEMYGGRIWAANRKDGGAAFRFVLPLARSAA